MTGGESIVVVGGGVGAAAAALALARSKRAAVTRIGPPPDPLTIIVWPRGWRALENLDVETKGLGVQLSALVYLNGEGERLSHVDVGGLGARLVTKKDLVARIDAAEKITSTSAMLEQLVPGARGFDYATSERPLQWKFASAVVGASGSDCRVRQALFGAMHAFAGGTAIIGRSETTLPEGEVHSYLAESAFLGVLSNPSGAGGSTWWLLADAGPFKDARGNILINGTGWGQPWSAALSGVLDQFGLRARAFMQSATYVRQAPARVLLDPAMPAGAARAALIGDSWRAATPELGLGATWALEDAERLGEQVRRLGVVRGFAEYVRKSTACAPEIALSREVAPFTYDKDAYNFRRRILSDPRRPEAAARWLARPSI